MSPNLHLVADEAAVAAEFRFRFNSSSSADLRQWSVWASLPLKHFFFFFVAGPREERTLCSAGQGKQTEVSSGSTGIVFLMAGKKKNKDFGDSWHTHTHRRECTPASSVLAAFGSQRLCFWSH